MFGYKNAKKDNFSNKRTKRRKGKKMPMTRNILEAKQIVR